MEKIITLEIQNNSYRKILPKNSNIFTTTWPKG